MENKKIDTHTIDEISPIEIELSDVIVEMRRYREYEELKKKLKEAERKLQDQS